MVCTQVCCDNYIVQPSYGEGNTGCCSGVSFDNRCYECKRELVAAIFDEEKELCCQGNIEKKKFGEKCVTVVSVDNVVV